MKKGLLLCVGNVLDRFTDLGRDIRVFCDCYADEIGEFKRLPSFTRQLPPVLPGNPVGKPASEFTSVEDYIYFAALSIINLHLYTYIFKPFHPTAGVDENERYEKQYEKEIHSCL